MLAAGKSFKNLGAFGAVQRMQVSSLQFGCLKGLCQKIFGAKVYV